MAHPRKYTQTSAWRGTLRRRLVERDGGCVWCGYSGDPPGTGGRLHIAHLVADPLGPADETNTVLMCAGTHRKWDAARRREVGL